MLFWVVENTAIKRKDIHLFIFKFSLLASVFSCEAWGGGGVQVKKNPCFIGVSWNLLYFHNLYHFFQCYRISSHKQHFQLFQFTSLIRQCRQLVILFTWVVSSLCSLIQPFQLLQFTNLIRQCSQLVTTQVQSPEILEMFMFEGTTGNWLLTLSMVRLLNWAMTWGSSLNWFTSDVSLIRFFSLLILVGNSAR